MGLNSVISSFHFFLLRVTSHGGLIQASSTEIAKGFSELVRKKLSMGTEKVYVCRDQRMRQATNCGFYLRIHIELAVKHSM